MSLSSPIRYSLLTCWFITGGLIILSQSGQPKSRFITLAVLSLGYFIWGVLDQYYTYHKFTPHIIIEYLLYTCLGLALASSLFYYGM